MYFAVNHDIDDKDLFAKSLAVYDEASMPPGYANPISYIAADGSRAFCLWTGPSIDGLQPWLDASTSGAHNTYWAVDPKAEGTIGIPA